MYVCSCRGVTDRTIATAIVAGARSVPELTAMCRAGGRCGGCVPELARLLAESELLRETEPHHAA
jgi:bacterioferritin-associated ferredoxin